MREFSSDWPQTVLTEIKTTPISDHIGVAATLAGRA